MEAISHQVCLHHPQREAVARCPECRQFFCRECITEHDDRVICADCLQRLVRAPVETRAHFQSLRRFVYCGAACLVSWLFFYESGRVLLLIPTSFHDGTLWHNSSP